MAAENVAAVLERRANDPGRFAALARLLDDPRSRIELEDYIEAVIRRESGDVAAATFSRARFYAELVRREGARISGSEQQDAVDAIDASIAGIHEAVDQACTRGDTDLLMAFSENMATFFTIVSRFHEGLALYRKLIIAAKQLGNAELLVRTQLEYGRSLFRLNEYDEALSELTESRDAAQQLGDTAAKADALMLLGRISYMQGTGNAQSCWEQALESYRTIGSRKGTAMALNNLATYAPSPSKAEEMYREAVEMGRQIGNQYLIGTCLYNLAALADDQGMTELAQATAEESLSIKRRLGDWLGVAQNLYILSRIAHTRSEFQKAEQLASESLELARKVGDIRFTIGALEQLGMVAHTVAKYDDAKGYYQEGLKLIKTLNNAYMEAGFLCHLGQLTHSRGNYLDAEELFKRALACGESGREDAGRAEAMYGLAQVRWGVGDRAQARSLLEQCLTDFREKGFKLRVADCLCILGALARVEQSYDEAARMLEEAENIFSTAGSVIDVASCRCHSALAASDQGNLKLGCGLVWKALQGLRGIDCTSAVIRALSVAGLVLAKARKWYMACVLLLAAQAATTRSGCVLEPDIVLPAFETFKHSLQQVDPMQEESFKILVEAASMEEHITYALAALNELRQELDANDQPPKLCHGLVSDNKLV